MLLRGVLVVAVLVSSALSWGQGGRWQLGNPSFIMDLPGQPGAANPDWRGDRLGFGFASAWAAESDDLRVEVAVDYVSQSLDAQVTRLAGVLGGTVSGRTGTTVSGYPGVRFQVGEARCLIAGDFGRYWTVVARPKTAAGVGIWERSLEGLRLEKWEEARWVARSFGKTYLQSELPYDLALVQAGGDGRPAIYALNYGDLQIEALVDQGAADRVDVRGTFDGNEAEIKGRESVKDFKASRRRVGAQGLTGDELDMTFTEGTRAYRVRTFAFKHRGDALRLKFTMYAGNEAHARDVERMLAGLKASTVVLDGYRTMEIGGEGIWLDLPGGMDRSEPQSGQRFYEKLYGNFAVDVRVTDTTRKGNVSQLADFVAAGAPASFGAPDMKLERSSVTVDGIEGYRLDGKYQNAGFTNLVRIYVLDTPGRIYVVRSVVTEPQKELLERVFGSMRIEPPAAPGWARHSISRGGVSALLPSAVGYEAFETASPFKSSRIGAVEDDGFIAFFVDFELEDESFGVAANLRDSLDSVADGMGISARIRSQQEVNGGIWAEITVTMDGEDRPGDWVMVKKNGHLVAILVIYDPEEDGAEQKRSTLVRSIR